MADSTRAGLEVAVQQFPSIDLYSGPDLDFIGVNQTPDGKVVPAARRLSEQRRKRASGAAGAPNGDTRRIVTKTVKPGRLAVYRHRCRRGERLVRSALGVGFFEDDPPTPAELADIDVTRTQRNGRIRVRVETGDSVGDDEQVRLQIHAICR